MSVCKASDGTPVFTAQDTGGYIQTNSSIQPMELEGLINITAGEFDGDTVEELAVYVPNSNFALVNSIELPIIRLIVSF